MDKGKMLLLARGARIESTDSKCGLLFETTGDSSLYPKGATHPIHVEELLGTRHWAEDRAAEVVRKLVANSATYDEIPVLKLVEEQLMHEFVGIFQALRLDGLLRDSGITSVQLHGERSWFERLSATREVTGSRYQLKFEGTSNSAVRQKLAGEYSGLRRTNWLRVAKFAARRVAPLHCAWVEARLAKSAPIQSGGIWFFGGAYNTTAIGLAYSSAIDGVRYCFADPDEGGRKVRERGLTGVAIFRLARLRNLPGRNRIRAVAEEVAATLRQVSLLGEEAQARDIYARSPAFDYLLRRILPWSLGLVQASKQMLGMARPEMIVVGNAAFERPLLLLAKAAGIPTVMLQHGVIHTYYRVLDQPVDHFLVRGEFFRECLGADLRSKAAVLDVPDFSLGLAADRKRGSDIVFITSPIEVEPRADFREVPEIVSVLLRKASETGARLMIRVHPTENVTRYQAMVEHLSRDLDPRPSVVFSHQGPIAPALASAAVAVLFHSTVFLECLAAGIPMVSPGWHEFPFKNRYADEQLFQFAENLDDLGRLAEKGLRGELKSGREKLSRFLRPTTKCEVRQFFNSIGAIKAKP